MSRQAAATPGLGFYMNRQAATAPGLRFYMNRQAHRSASTTIQDAHGVIGFQSYVKVRGSVIS